MMRGGRGVARDGTKHPAGRASLRYLRRDARQALPAEGCSARIACGGMLGRAQPPEESGQEVLCRCLLHAPVPLPMAQRSPRQQPPAQRLAKHPAERGDGRNTPTLELKPHTSPITEDM